MILTNKQEKFILDKFFYSHYAGSENIAKKLINDGTCVVAGGRCIWEGGVGNWIKTTEEKEFFGCLRYHFDIDEFVKSKWFLEILDSEISKTFDEKNELAVKYKELNDLR